MTDTKLIKLDKVNLDKLCKAARKTKLKLDKSIKKILTPERCSFVRRLRVDLDYTWRAVASECYDKFNGDWEPSSNQLVGMSLCEHSAKYFNEDGDKPPWN